MKIKSIRIENFRSFQDETINVNGYTCFAGPNGAGKSTVLAALNVFFQERTAATDTSKLIDQDYFCKHTGDPVRITLTFCELGDKAKEALKAYVRGSELVVTAEATFDPSSGVGDVRHFGQRLGMDAFRRFFEADKAGAKASELGQIYKELQTQFAELPNARSKADEADGLRTFEAGHPDQCVQIPSEDDFYGVNSNGMLAQFVQWVYVPAVKDAGDEEVEAKNTALGKLVARAVRAHTNFDTEVETLRNDALQKYQDLLDRNQGGLTDVSASLQHRLEAWFHPGVRLTMEWQSDPNRSVVVQTPVAGIKTGNDTFLGSLSRMGHGLQRSYLLALLQELADSDAPDAPTLVLGCEEPELYQHPPQARHLADVFDELAQGNNQILVTTHSPLFVSGNGFENTRVVYQRGSNAGSEVRALTFANLCARLREVAGEDAGRPTTGLIAKIHQALQPGIAEMFFTRVPVLVEGLEDVSYITTQLHLSGKWADFRRLGCHLIPVNGKDKLIKPLAMAIELGLSAFVVFDADGNTTRPDHRVKHEQDNRALMNLLGINGDSFPSSAIIAGNHAIWPSNLTELVKADFGQDYDALVNATRSRYGNEGGLEKHDLFIADWVASGWEQGHRSPTLSGLCDAILDFAQSNAG